VDKEAVKKDSLWLPYFQSIKNNCPWSLKAYMKEKILFLDWSDTTYLTWTKLFQSTKYEAFVFKCNEKSVEWLEAITQNLNDLEDGNEYLWSHPEEGGESTPVPVVICQDEQMLNELREKLDHG
jgi:hypothetical protein